MFTSTIVLLLTISLVINDINCYAVDNSDSIKNEVKSETDYKPMPYTNNEVNIQNRTSTLNIPKADNVMDYSTFRTNGNFGGSMTEMESGRKKYNIKFPNFGKYGKYGKISKSGKKKKYKWLYPIIIGLFITKMIMFPLFVKAVTILSSGAFVFSKMSLLASLILGLKFFLSNNNQNNDSKVEIVHVPLKKYGGDWDRETSETKFHNLVADNVYDHELRPTRFVL